MTDAITKKPIRIIPHEGGGGSLTMVPAEQIEPVMRVLQQHGIRCWQTGGILSIDGDPGTGWITLGKNESITRAQAVLDAVP